MMCTFQIDAIIFVVFNILRQLSVSLLLLPKQSVLLTYGGTSFEKDFSLCKRQMRLLVVWTNDGEERL